MRIWLFVLTCSLFLTSPLLVEAELYTPDTSEAVVIGVQQDTPIRELNFLKASIDEYLLANGNTPLTLRILPREDILVAVKERELDFVFSDAPLFAVLESHYGNKAVAAILPQESRNEETVTAGALIVAEHSTMRTLHDAEGKPFFHLKGSLRTLLAADLADQGYDLKKFFSHLQPASETVEEAVARVVAQPETSALIPACWLEKNRMARGADQVRVLEPRNESRFSCEQTTSAYPGWTISQTLNVSPKVVKSLSFLFFSLPMSESGLIWTRSPDYRRLHIAMEKGEDPLYVVNREETLKELLKRYAPLVLTVFAAIFALVVYGYLVSRIASRRTREVVKLMKAKELSDRRFSALEKISIVGQMSSVVAHELKQPLSAIETYASSLMRRSERDALSKKDLVWALGKIAAETARADEIIEHVRNYARREVSVRQQINFSVCVERAVHQLISRLSFKGSWTVTVEPGIFVVSDELEVTLIVSNLLKNAAEACNCGAHDDIAINLYREDTKAVLVVTDTGRQLSDDDIELLSVPLRTTKKVGLGLGISIVRRIIESSEGELSFARNTPKGLIITIRLPIKNED